MGSMADSQPSSEAQPRTILTKQNTSTDGLSEVMAQSLKVGAGTGAQLRPIGELQAKSTKS